MKKNYFSLSIFLLTLVLASLACTVFVGGPDTSQRPVIPVSAEALESLKLQIEQAMQNGAQSGVVTLQINETQITSYLAFKLASDSNPMFTDPQVYLRDGQMQIYGKSQRGMFTANIGIIVSVGIDETGQPAIEIVSADFGPFPVPGGLKDALTAAIREAYTGTLGPVATGFRIESITIADGLMTVTGRIK